MTYQDEVLADSPSVYCRLDETSGTTATNLGSNGSAVITYVSTPTLGVTGLISQGTAVQLTAAQSEDITVSASILSTNFSFEYWFKWPAGAATAPMVRDHTSSGGCQIGFDNSGTFGVRWAGSTFSTSLATTAVRDNATHHFVMDKTGTNVKVYVDGNLVLDTNSALNTASTGVWHVGRNGSSAAYTDLTVDELAIYPAALGATRAAAHFAAGGVNRPTNTVAPAVSGTRVVGESLATTDGTWINSPTSYAYQWKRDGVAISEATASTYVAQTADVAHTITCAVTASNANGASDPATSNGLNIVAEMIGGDVVFKLAAGGGLGGSPGTVISSPTSVYDSVTFPEAQTGDTEYRVVYITNSHAVRSLTLTALWVSAQTTSPTSDIAVGVAVEAAGQDVTAIPSESTAPVGVTFSAPSSEGSGVSVGTLTAGQSRGVWLRRIVLPNTTSLTSDVCTLAWSGTPA